MSDDHTSTPKEQIATLTKETTFTQRQAQVWVLAYELGYSQEEIADKLMIEPGTVASHKSRARQKVGEARSLLSHTCQSFEYVAPIPDADEGAVRHD